MSAAIGIPPTPSLTRTKASQPSDNHQKEQAIKQARSELCEDWLPYPVQSWGPLPLREGAGFVKSWTETISHDIGNSRHYITCDGSKNGVECLGRWNRRDRPVLGPGLHCIYGSWVMYDGKVISEVNGVEGEGRLLKRPRKLWAEHVLETGIAEKRSEEISSYPIVSATEVEEVYGMLQHALDLKHQSGHNKSREKAWGSGYGGKDGMLPSGMVVKRDHGSEPHGRRREGSLCQQDVGGYFRPGGLELWVFWSGWSGACTRDGRFRPGYHLECLLTLLTTITDYGATRSLWRVRDIPWAQAMEWACTNTPFDVPVGFVHGCKPDLKELVRQELVRLKTTAPTMYKARACPDRATQYQPLLDRAGNTVGFNTVGEGLDTHRGFMFLWQACISNDVLDYERDVPAGETNNLARGLTSDQQVVDATFTMMYLVEASLDNGDYDMCDALLGTFAIMIVYTRYNVMRLFAYYAPQEVRSQHFSHPPEAAPVMESVYQYSIPSPDWEVSYGELYDRIDAKLQQVYVGCTCATKPDGHDN